MAVIWRADCSLPMGDEWRRLSAHDGNPKDRDPTGYTGNRAMQVAPPVPVGSFPLVYRMVCQPGDTDQWTSGASRTELSQVNNGSAPPGVDRLMHQGQTRYIGWQVMFDTNFVNSACNQLKGMAQGNGPMGFGFRAAERVEFHKSLSQAFGSTNLDHPWVDPRSSTPKNVWLAFVVAVHWSTGSDGWYELHGDIADGQGFRVLQARRNGWTLKFHSDGGPTSVGMSIGNYMPRASVTRTSWFAGVNVSTTMADAVAAAQIGAGTTPPPPPPPPVTPVDVNDPVAVDALFANAGAQLTGTDTSLDPPAYPHFTVGTAGTWSTVGTSHWTSGFLPGLFWKMFAETGDAAWRTRAETWQSGISGQSGVTTNHDLGFMFMSSFVEGYRLTQVDSYRTTALTAATSLSSRWSANVGAIRSFDSGVHGMTDFNTIIDSMMNMELLFWASKNGAADATDLYARALSHANKIRTSHVRANGSSYQVTTYNSTTGAVIAHPVIQGAGTESTWARGQAWGIHGFTMAYRETLIANPADAANFLATAKQMAGYFLDNLPADGIPRWDFNAPATDLQKDSSAAAIAAAGLAELAQYDASRDWRGAAHDLLGILGSSDYQAPLAHSAILLHGVSNRPGNIAVDQGLVYGDHYFIEALRRYQPPQPPQPRALSSLNDPMDTGVDFPTRSGNVSFVSGEALLSVSTTVARSFIRTAPLFNEEGQGVIIGPIAWPSWISGTGEVHTYLTWEVAGNHRVVIRRKTVYGAAGVVGSDVLECRVVVANSDTAPLTFTWASLPSGTNHLKIGFLSAGRDVSFQVSSNGATFTQITSRTIPTTVDLSQLSFIEAGVFRATGDVITSTVRIDRAYGTTNPNPDASGPGEYRDDSLSFSGDDIRVFPLALGPTQPPIGFLSLIKPSTVTRLQAVFGVSENNGSSGRFQAVASQNHATLPRDLFYRDRVGAPDVGLGGGDLPLFPAWVLVFCGHAANGQVTVRWWDPVTNTFQHRENIGTITAGANITDAAARYVIGNPYPGSVGGEAFAGEWVMSAAYNKVLTSAEFEALVTGAGVVTRGSVIASGPVGAVDWESGQTTATTQILDFISTDHESTGQRVGTQTVTTAADTVPYDSTEAGTPPPPTPTVSVPQATGFTVTNAQITPASNPQTGEATLTVDATAAVPALNYVPHATAPYGFFFSLDGDTWTQHGSWQASNTKPITDVALDPGDGSEEVLWSARYRDNTAAPAGPHIGDLATPVSLVIASPPPAFVPLTPVDNLGYVRSPGQLEASWDVPPSEEGVSFYKEWVVALPNAIDYTATPTWTGVGTVANGRVTAPPVTGLSDGARYRVGVKAARDIP